jgi:hypothetical protein
MGLIGPATDTVTESGIVCSKSRLGGEIALSPTGQEEIKKSSFQPTAVRTRGMLASYAWFLSISDVQDPACWARSTQG